ncbi:MAG: hypothetical protein Q7T01_03825 [bacterium]|nr:hypothetical protein [bacterium]
MRLETTQWFLVCLLAAALVACGQDTVPIWTGDDDAASDDDDTGNSDDDAVSDDDDDTDDDLSFDCEDSDEVEITCTYPSSFEGITRVRGCHNFIGQSASDQTWNCTSWQEGRTFRACAHADTVRLAKREQCEGGVCGLWLSVEANETNTNHLCRGAAGSQMSAACTVDDHMSVDVTMADMNNGQTGCHGYLRN